jgi:hypothetical protein
MALLVCDLENGGSGLFRNFITHLTMYRREAGGCSYVCLSPDEVLMRPCSPKLRSKICLSSSELENTSSK